MDKIQDSASTLFERHSTDIIEQISDAFCAVDADWRCISMNRRLATLTGQPRPHLLDSNFWETCAPILGLEERTEIRHAVQAGCPVTFDYFAPSCACWFTLRVYPTDVGTNLYWQDITQRKQAEAALRASEEKFAKVFHAGPVIITITRLADGRLIEVNESFVRMTGYSRDDVIGRTPIEVGLWVEPQKRDEGLAQLKAGHPPRNSEHFFRMKDGTIRPFIISAESLEFNGQTCVLTVLNDMTERKQAEDALRELNTTLDQQVQARTEELTKRLRELDEFAYVTSHDLKSPLRAIDHLAQWISDDAHDLLPASSQQHLAKMHGRIRRMEKLLDDLLAYSRADRNTDMTEIVETGTLIEEITRLIAPPQGFAVTAASPMPVLITQRIPLETVLRNLIGNAIKHHHRTDGQVQVSARALGDFIEFAVTDDGPGIPPEYHERIFQLFQTLKPRDQVEGSGLGLAIVKKIVEGRGGQITVESLPGSGVTFHFTWPKG